MPGTHLLGAVQPDPAGQSGLDVRYYGAGCSDEGVAIPWGSLDLRLTAASYEENYATYLDRMAGGQEISRSDAGAGLTGAVGVFGSAALDHRTVRIVVENPTGAETGAPGRGGEE